MYYSKELAGQINKNYKFKFHHEWDMNMRKMYMGHVSQGCLKNDNERIAYLLGAWVCFGEIDNDQFLITIRRSNDKFKLILSSLQKLGCDIVKVENLMQTNLYSGISHIESQTVTFKPTGELANQIDRFTELVRRLENKRAIFYQSLE